MSQVSNTQTPVNQARTRSPYLAPLLVIPLPACLGEVTPASPLAQGASRVSRSDLSCWMPYDRLFVKLVCCVCSCSPPLPLLTVSPLWIWRAQLCFVRLIGTSVGPKWARTHLCSLCGSICWLICPLFNPFCLFTHFSGWFGVSLCCCCYFIEFMRLRWEMKWNEMIKILSDCRGSVNGSTADTVFNSLVLVNYYCVFIWVINTCY